MRIRRMTITLPRRYRDRAAEEARRIAQAAAENIGERTPRRLSIELHSPGDVPGAVGRRLAAQTGGGK
jgi:hypothetical protein